MSPKMRLRPHSASAVYECLAAECIRPEASYDRMYTKMNVYEDAEKLFFLAYNIRLFGFRY